ncbi:MAG: hypothetical protein ACM3ND_14905, partial [Acidobacteriota bacterium]
MSRGLALLNVTFQLQQLIQAPHHNCLGFLNPVWNVIGWDVDQTSFQKGCPKSLFLGILARWAHVFLHSV